MVISNLLRLDPGDEKAKSFLIDSLEVCAVSRTLSRKMLARLPDAPRSLIAIFGSGVDLARMASYGSGYPIPEDPDFVYPGATEQRPTERLVQFLAEYLGSGPEAVVVSEDWLLTRSTIPNKGLYPPRISCLGDEEVYYLLTPEFADPTSIEDSVTPGARFQTGVCSTSSKVPQGDMEDETFLDEVAEKAQHVFVPAFDGSGYLIWSLI